MAYITSLLKSISPSYSDTNIPTDTSVVIYFDAAMDRLSLNENTVYIQAEDTKIDAKYTYNNKSRTLTIEPLAPLEPSTLHKIIIVGGNSGVKNIVGAIAFKGYEFEFTTGEALVQEPPIEEPPIEGEPPVEEPPTEEQPVEDGNPIIEEPEGTLPPVEDTFDYLMVVDSYPNDSQLFDIAKPIVLQFSIPIKPGQDSMFSFKEKEVSSLLETFDNIPVSVSYSHNNQRVSIKPNGVLFTGQEYQLTVDKNLMAADESSLDINHTINILTQYENFYTTVEDIRLVGGNFAVKYSDLEIAKLIGNASKSLYAMMSQLEKFSEDGWTVYTGPYGAAQYTLYSVLYQIILGESLSVASGSSNNISLGDLTVGGSSTTSSSLPDLLALLKSELDKWWSILLSSDPLAKEDSVNWVRAASSAVRGLTDYPYPDFQTRIPFSDLGG